MTTSLKQELLEADYGQRDPRYSATLRAHGEYMPLAFVLRLSPAVHAQLDRLPKRKTATSKETGFDGALAMSTYFHETIHWWQHIGSTYGLMSSLSYPARAHANYLHIKKLQSLGALKKSVRKVTEQERGGESTPETVAGLANIIVNNHFDLSAFSRFTYNLNAAKNVVQDPLFESLGHLLQMTYGHNLGALAVVDKNFQILPDPRKWGAEFEKLRNRKVEGFFYGSRISLWPVGAREILEGQACFSQMQYLHFASGGTLEWDDFRGLGMLHGVYKAAFKEFLARTELDWPNSINHPTVALFLLICDMAMNPGSGFPFDPFPFFQTFINDVVPGIRFTAMSRMVRLKLPHLLGAITRYNREEYQEVSEEISKLMLDHSPMQITARCAGWAKGPLSFLMDEYRTYRYSPENNAVRVLLSHFLAFNQDKADMPEYFCWPGVYSAGENLSDKAAYLFERHGALFVDREHDSGIYPRLREGYDEAAIQEMFDNFYAAVVTYEMTDQLAERAGPFSYEYDWLKPASPAEFKQFADRQFAAIYGVAPDNILIA